MNYRPSQEYRDQLFADVAEGLFFELIDNPEGSKELFGEFVTMALGAGLYSATSATNIVERLIVKKLWVRFGDGARWDSFIRTVTPHLAHLEWTKGEVPPMSVSNIKRKK